jgi:N-acetylglucosamine malate deacetylase 2
VTGRGNSESWAEGLAKSDEPLHGAMVVVAHPDDETIGGASLLSRLLSPVLVHLTDGAPRDMHDANREGFSTVEEYAAHRRREMEAALRVLGVKEPILEGPLCPDQRASACLPELTETLVHLMQHHKPEVVITHSYEGGHPDHDATAFAVQATCSLTNDPPARVEMACYRQGPDGILAGEFLPGPRAFVRQLTDEEQERKQRALACYASQQGTLRYFGTGHEAFRAAPNYDFTRPPHEGRLFYEQFGWGTTGEQFRALAAEAQRKLHRELAVPR